jgi:2-polyprenyl-6-methoxyphenol hydroxylase-like FAD-dependent oxidoreductase
MIQSLIEKKTAIVVGAGPAGLLTSIILQKRGWKTTIIEKSSGIKKDKSKSYQYLLDGRGQTILNHLNLLPPIISESVLSSQVKLFIEYLPSRTIKQSNFSLSFGAEIEKYWIPRDVFLNVLFHFIKELNQQVDDSLKIQLLFNTSCRDISLGITDASDEDNRIRVSCNDDESIVLTADLVVACDGLNSAVRTSLKRLYGDPFDIQTYPCLANLRFKTLSLMDGCINTSSTAFTVIR